ncbi:SDR family NAD(P)-dependent oxidoreductase, partial [Klebsiella pneumoniae]|nr:SDR family NAD(P)-dependent oxidoreductase [Klebsiella pneumoniae]
LARRGFDVVATMRDPGLGAGMADEAGEDAHITVERLDVNDESTMRMPAGLRVLVNNAGVESDNLPLEVMPADAWRAIYETNVFGLV